MAEMSMNKAIHAAFRRDLGRFLGALERFTDGDRTRAGQLGTAWANFELQLTNHHEGEHQIAWPALQQVGASRELIDQMDSEHEQLAEALAAADVAMKTFASAASRGEADAARVAVQRLQDVAELHMTHEEATIEPLYLAKSDDPAIKAMGKQFGKVSPKVGGTFFAWVTDGAGPEEMRAIQASVPKPVITIIGGIFGRGYRRDIAPTWAAKA